MPEKGTQERPPAVAVAEPAAYRAGQLAEQRHQADDPTVPDLAAYIAVTV